MKERGAEAVVVRIQNGRGEMDKKEKDGFSKMRDRWKGKRRARDPASLGCVRSGEGFRADLDGKKDRD